jgi:protein SCO1/2
LSLRAAAILAALALPPALAGCAPHAAQAPASAPAQSGPGGPFQLEDYNGRPVDQTVLDGKWSVVFFGYTFCPDVCPTTLTALGQAMKDLGAKAAQTQVVFITVDPARDTPKVMQDYASSFGASITGLSGSPQAIGAAEKAYRVFSRKGPVQSDGSYSMDHSSVVYLMDKSGGFVRSLNLDRPPEETARELERFL